MERISQAALTTLQTCSERQFLACEEEFSTLEVKMHTFGINEELLSISIKGGVS
jgi:hypothetical protein